MARIDTLKNFLSDIADKLREKLGTEEAIAHAEYDTRIDEVYEAGEQSEYNRFWNNYLLNGERSDFSYAFFGEGWNNETFKPNLTIKPTSMLWMFAESSIVGDLGTILNKNGISLDTSTCTNFERAFRYSKITSLPVIDTTNCDDLTYIFYYATDVATIEKLILKDDGSQKVGSGTFNYCTALENINEIEGQIGQNGLRFYTNSVNNSNNLSHDTLVRILNALQDKSTDTSGTSWAVQLGTVNLNKLSDDEKAIATDKGWSLT